jgi:predicted MPP superfamily phosphohydrolase
MGLVRKQSHESQNHRSWFFMTRESGNNVTRRQFLKTLAGGTLAAGVMVGGGVGLTALMEPYNITLERVQIALRGLPESAEGLRIVQLSDLHLYPYTKLPHIERAIAITNELQPDVVVLTGDYVLESAEAIFDLAPALSRLNPRIDVFATLGNHDYWTNNQIIEQGFAENGIRLLKNDRVVLSNGLVLAGLDDPWSGRPDLNRTLDGISPDQTTILLAHEPDFVDVYGADPRVDLMLSGHTHGGQVVLPLVGAPYLPRYGRKYLRGLYHLADTQLYVNRGIGTTARNLRFNAKPEITEITVVGG